jgi:hypothetical protein
VGTLLSQLNIKMATGSVSMFCVLCIFSFYGLGCRSDRGWPVILEFVDGTATGPERNHTTPLLLCLWNEIENILGNTLNNSFKQWFKNII